MSRPEEVYVVGCGMHPFGRDESVSGMDMAERAIREALADAGVAWADIGYAAGGSDVSGKPDTLVGRLGLTGVPFVNVQNGCATGASTVLAVANALRAGEASLGLAVGFDKHERGAFHVSAARYGLGEWYAETGMMLTTQFFALKTQRYLHEYAIEERALAMVAARAFRNGSRHPLAWRRKELTEEEILGSAEVSPPLTQYMFCSPGQGAAALVLARGDRAFDLCERPVKLASLAFRTRRFGSFEVFASAAAGTPPQPQRGRGRGRLPRRRSEALGRPGRAVAGHRQRFRADPPGGDRAVRARRAAGPAGLGCHRPQRPDPGQHRRRLPGRR